MYGEEAAAGVCGEDNQAAAESEGGEEDGGGSYESSPSSQAAATVGRVRVSEGDGARHGTVSKQGSNNGHQLVSLQHMSAGFLASVYCRSEHRVGLIKILSFHLIDEFQFHSEEPGMVSFDIYKEQTKCPHAARY